MIAEDSRLQTALLRHALTLQGYVVVVAQNGDEALRMIRQRKPTLVISDIVMPKIDGYELMFCDQARRSLERYSRYTAHTTIGTRRYY